MSKWLGIGSPRFSGSSILPATTPVTISNGGTLDMTNGTQTIASLSLDGWAWGAWCCWAAVCAHRRGRDEHHLRRRDLRHGRDAVKQGAGTLMFSGRTTYSGPTTIDSGVLQAVDGVGLPTASNLVFAGSLGQTGVGAVLQSSGTFSRTLGTGVGQVQWIGDGGFSANGGPLR